MCPAAALGVVADGGDAQVSVYQQQLCACWWWVALDLDPVVSDVDQGHFVVRGLNGHGLMPWAASMARAK